MNRIVAFFALAFCFFSGPANAHEQKAALTKVVFNDRTNNIEVMHRLSRHDAEHAARDLWEGADLEDPQTLRNLANYVRSRFSLANGLGDDVTLTVVGEEIDDVYLWVYHEAPIDPKLGKLTIENRILFEFWDDQSNLVNLEIDGNVFSHTFSQRAARRSFDVERSVDQ